MCFAESAERFYDVLFEDMPDNSEKTEIDPPKQRDGFKS